MRWIAAVTLCVALAVREVRNQSGLVVGLDKILFR